MDARYFDSYEPPPSPNGLTREDIYEMREGIDIDKLVEATFDDADISHPRPFSSDMSLCFGMIVSGFSWFRLSRNNDEGDYWCELRIFPKDYIKRGVYYKHVAGDFNPALAICKAYLVFVNRRGSCFGNSGRNFGGEYRNERG